MQFFRRFQPVQAISFDLDDTLYDNHPIMQRAERALFSYLQRAEPRWRSYQPADWYRNRAILLEAEPELHDDVSLLRQRVMAAMLMALGVDSTTAYALAAETFAHFLKVRSDFEVDPAVRAILAELAQRLPLIAISNGNANLDQIGIGAHFQFALYAGDGTPAKPDPALYRQAEARLALAPAQILHVGDNLHTDVLGARRAGWQSALTTEYLHDRGPHLPDLKITALAQLLALVDPAIN